MLQDSVSAADLQAGLSGLLQELTEADAARVRVRNGLPSGAITLEDAWRVFDKNRSLRVVRVPKTEADVVEEHLQLQPGTITGIAGDFIRVAVDQPATSGLIASAGITYLALEPQGIDEPGLREVDLVRRWLARQPVVKP